MSGGGVLVHSQNDGSGVVFHHEKASFDAHTAIEKAHYFLEDFLWLIIWSFCASAFGCLVALFVVPIATWLFILEAFDLLIVVYLAIVYFVRSLRALRWSLMMLLFVAIIHAIAFVVWIVAYHSTRRSRPIVWYVILLTLGFQVLLEIAKLVAVGNTMHARLIFGHQWTQAGRITESTRDGGVREMDEKPIDSSIGGKRKTSRRPPPPQVSVATPIAHMIAKLSAERYPITRDVDDTLSTWLLTKIGSVFTVSYWRRRRQPPSLQPAAAKSKDT